MSFWMSGVLRKPLVRNYTNARRKVTDAIVLHVAAGEAASLQGWFNNPRAGASSHFYVRRDGTVEQYLPIDRISWSGVRSDQRAISIETQGMGHGEWTAAQINAIVKIVRYCRDKYPTIPARQMTSSKRTEKGIGYHRLGVPGSYAQKALGKSQTGGELWSGAVGKICPGPDRIKQVPTIVAMVKGATTPAKPTPKPTPSTPGKGYGVDVATVQRQLKTAGYYSGGLVDGDYGKMTRDAVTAYQRAQRYMPGLLVDGEWGKLTQAHYEWVRTLQGALNKWRTSNRVGKTIVDGDFGPFVDRLVKQTMSDNMRGAYTKAVKALYGRLARPINDGEPGPAFCRMLNIKPHPLATK